MKKLFSRSSFSSSHTIRPSSPAPSYRTIDPTPTAPFPADIKPRPDSNLPPQHLQATTILLTTLRASPDYRAHSSATSLLHFLVQFKPRIEGTFRQLIWDREVNGCDDLAQKEFYDIVEFAQAELVREVLDEGGGVNVHKGGLGELLLRLSVDVGNKKVVDMLFERGVSIERVVSSLVSDASRNGDGAMVGLLLSKKGGGGQVFFGRRGRLDEREIGAPLIEAAKGGYVDVAKVLIESGAEVDLVHDGWTPLFHAVVHGAAEVARLLIKHGADVERKTPAGKTALVEAALMGHETVVRVLVGEGGARVESPVVGHYLAGHGLEEAAVFVIERLRNGVDVNERMGRMEETIMHQAAKKGLEELVRTLLDQGAYGYSRDCDGRTPRELALRNGHKEVVKILDASEKKNAVEDKEVEDDPPPPYTE